MAVQTRHFPLLFVGAGALFSGLFVAFYLLVFDAIRGIFIVQDQSILEELTTETAQQHQQLLREAKILHRSRGIQRIFASEQVQMPDRTFIRSLQQRLIDWRAQFPAEAYRSGSYLNSDQVPIAVVDFSLHGKYGANGEVGGMDVYNNAPTDDKGVLPNPIIENTWSVPNLISGGSYAVQYSNGMVVIRTILPVLDRRTREPNGYLAIDYETPDSWMLEEGKDLHLLDRKRGHVAYSSSDPDAAGQPVGSLDGYIRDAVHALDGDAPSSSVVNFEDRELLHSRQMVLDTQLELAITTHLDPYTGGPRMRGRLLIVASLLFVLIAGISIYVLTTRVRRNTEALKQANDELEKANTLVSDQNRVLEEELQTAHDMQMRLMPQETPDISGFDIRGGCIPATAVGGDFYQYFSIADERLVIVLADVTGHGMQAAVPTMVFSGLLDTQVNYSHTAEELMPQLNRSLHRVLEPRTFVCLSLGELNPLSGQLRLSNGGCPYPFIYRTATQEVEEVDLNALPLGVRAESNYGVREFDLNPGDIVVMCSDGIIEAANPAGELFGFDRVAKAILLAGTLNMNAQELINHLFDDVAAFADFSERDDDQTVVVLIRNRVSAV